MNPPNHIRFIVGCITVLGLAAGVGGYLLLSKGYQGGEIFATMAGGAITGLLGMLSMRGQTSQSPNVIASPDQPVIVNQPNNNPTTPP